MGHYVDDFPRIKFTHPITTHPLRLLWHVMGRPLPLPYHSSRVKFQRFIMLVLSHHKLKHFTLYTPPSLPTLKLNANSISDSRNF
jgi:hypothetical protein